MSRILQITPMTLQPLIIKTAFTFLSFLFFGVSIHAQTISCVLEDIVIECIESENEILITEWADANFEKVRACACDSVIGINSDFNPGNYDLECGSNENLTVTYEIAGCGDNNLFIATLSITDDTPPILTCEPDGLIIECASNPEDILAEVLAWNASNIEKLQACSIDECSTEIIITNNFDEAGLSCDNDVSVVYTITDNCGNLSEISAVVDFINDDTGGDDTGCGAVGGVFITIETDTTEVTVCVGDDISDAVYAKVWEEEGDGSSYIITDADGNILRLAEGIRFEFEGTEAGTNFIYHVSTDGDVTGLSEGSNISDISGCFELSNAIKVNKVEDGADCGCAMTVSLGQPTVICEGDEITIDADVMNSNICEIICAIENGRTLVEWDMDACHSITNGVDNMDFSELAPSYPNADDCVNVTATPVDVEGGAHSCTIPKDGLDGRAMCFSGSKKCYWKDDSPDALKFSVTLTPENSSTITGLQFYESAPERFTWYNPDFSEDIDEGPNNFPRFYGLRVTKNGEEIFQENDIPTTNNWTLEEFDFSNNEEFKVEENATFVFELLAYCPSWRNAITYAWDLDNIKLLGGCCEKDTTITAVDYIWSTGETSESITVSPTENSEYSVTVTDCMGCVATRTLPVRVNEPVSADLGDDISVCIDDLPVTLTHSTEGINTLHPRVEWSTGEVGESILVSEPGTYTVTVTDGLACSETDEINVTVSEPDPISLPDGETVCEGSTINLSTLEPSGQTGGVWTASNDEVVTEGGAGTYTYTYSDANDCSVSDQITITEDSFSFSIDNLGPICPDDSFDFSTIVPDGVVGDTWEVVDLGDNNYRFTGQNANGCSASAEFSISIDDFSISLGDTPILCDGEEYMLSAHEPSDYTGGVWTDSEGNMVEKATPGMFTYTVSNDNGCSASDKINFTGSDFVVMQIQDDTVCWGDSLLLSSLEFSDQSGGVWKDLNNNVAIYGKHDTRYRYHFFDGVNGCTHIVDIRIHEKHCPDPCEGFTVPVGDAPEVCPGDSIMITSLEVDGYSGGVWKDLNSNVVTKGTIGTYTYNYFEEENGCAAVVEVEIHHQHDGCTDPCEEFSVSVDNPEAICEDETLMLSSLEQDGSEGGTWTNGDGATVSSAGVGSYVYTFTNPEGCIASTQIEIVVKECIDPCDIFNISFTNPDAICNDATFDLTSLVSSAAAGGEWTNADDTVVTVVGPGTYTYSVTTDGGCSATADVTIVGEDCSDPCEGVSIDIPNPAAICTDSTINLNDIVPSELAGGSWMDVDGNEVTEVPDGIYTYTLTNSEGCVVSATITIEGEDCEDECDDLAQFEMANGIIEVCKDELPVVFKYDLSCIENLAIAGPHDSWAFLDDTSGGPGLELYNFDAEYIIEVVNQDLEAVLYNITIKEKDCGVDPCDDHVPSFSIADVTICENDAPYVYIPTLTCTETVSYTTGGAQIDFSTTFDSLFVFTSGAVDVAVTAPNGVTITETFTVTVEDCSNPCDEFEAVIDLGEDIAICQDDFPITIDLGELSCAMSITTVDDGSAFIDVNNIITFLEFGTFPVTVTDANGLTAVDTMIVSEASDCTGGGVPCDDGNPNTENDVQIDDCNCCGTPIAGQVIYVDKDAAGATNGSSWTDAFTDLQEAMQTAESGQEIWLADGTYLPTQDGDRDVYFNLPSGVDLYGGFSGTEQNICQRDFTTTRSILSGDLDGDDKSHSTNLIPLELLFEGTEENSHYVLRNSQLTEDVKIDGIAITGGVADGSETAGGGGFLFVNDTDVTIEMNNVLVVANQGVGLGGGGRLNTRSATTLTVKMDRVVFLQNRVMGPALSKGGGFFAGGWEGGKVEIEVNNSVFAQNFAQDRGGAYNADDNVEASFINSLFAGNRAANGGAIFETTGSNGTTVTNSTFYVNFADAAGGAIVNFNGSGTADIRNSILFGNATGLTGGPGLDNFGNASAGFTISNSLFSELDLATLNAEAEGIDDAGGNLFASDPLFTDPLNADFSLQSGSPAVNSGDNSHVSLSDDLVGNDRIQEDVVDMGALESGQESSCVVDIFEIASAGLVLPDFTELEFIIQEESESELVTSDEIAVKTFPNPTTDELNVVVSKSKEEDGVSLQLYDMSGKVLPTHYSVTNDMGMQIEYKIPVKDFRGGVYFLKTKVGRHTINKRVIVIK